MPRKSGTEFRGLNVQDVKVSLSEAAESSTGRLCRKTKKVTQESTHQKTTRAKIADAQTRLLYPAEERGGVSVSSGV